MKRFPLLLIAALFIAMPLSASAQTAIWKVDKAHTSVKFEVEHLTVSLVAGQFLDFDGAMISDKSDFTDAKIDFTVQTKSVNTNVEKRDQHLRSPDFFDVEKYPQMSFKNIAFKKDSEGRYVLAGDLTIKDVTKPVVFDVTYWNTVLDPWGNTRTGFRAKLKINRFDYHINYRQPFGKNALDVAPEANIIIDTELTKNK
jgi:polyisoprenoid-binding protein YceI